MKASKPAVQALLHSLSKEPTFQTTYGTIAFMKKHILYLWTSAAFVLLLSSYLSWDVVLAEHAGMGIFLACSIGMVGSVSVLLYFAVLMMLDMEMEAAPTNASLELGA